MAKCFFILTLFFPLFFEPRLWGLNIQSIEGKTGFLWSMNSVGDSAPDPICNTLGVALPCELAPNFIFRPEVQVFFQTYAYENARAVPVESMFDSVVMMGLLLNPTVGYEYAPLPSLKILGEVGLGLIARVPVFFQGNTGKDQVGPVIGWFWLGRFLYPNMGLTLTWKFSSSFLLVVSQKNFFPLFNLWDSSTVWWDHFLFEFSLGFRFLF